MTKFIETLINSNPALSNEDAKALCYAMHNAKDEKKRIENRNKFALSFSKYAYSVCIKNSKGKGLSVQDIEDMFSDILEVILEKAWTYDCDNAYGACFITYIQEDVKKAAIKSFNGEKTDYFIRTMDKINKVENEFQKLYGEEPSIEELSELTGLSEKVIRNAYLMKERYMTASIYDKTGNSDECELTYGDLATESVTVRYEALSPEEAYIRKETLLKLKKGISELSFVEKFAVEHPELSERKAVEVLQNKYGLKIARTTYQGRRNAAVRKLSANF